MVVIREVFTTHSKECPRGHEHENLFNFPSFRGDEDREKYCIDCGDKLITKESKGYTTHCSACNSYVGDSWAYCLHCGEKL